MALRSLTLLLLVASAVALRTQKPNKPEVSAVAPVNLTQVELDKEKILQRALTAMETVQSENARSYFYMFDEKLYSCWQGPIRRLESIRNFLRMQGMQESYFEKKLKYYQGTCDDMCMRNGWTDRRSCIKNVHQCRHPEWKVMDGITHKLHMLATELNSTRPRMLELIEQTDIEKTCTPNATALFRY
uniref:Uncharacterized protein n=1 Tax=Alexandrium andersonii TaxID=327968 RepID=A0A7S2FQ28_9DINO|mmetsp:Transcript_30670/g.69875  ORF Transcript_30670/g.69875 Transcript_30670/m.69875 type:complete len:187 (+) Transcript_30670:74-634(+)